MHLLDDTTSLPDGTRIRLRLPHSGDRAELRALHGRLGLQADDLEIGRALRFDPRTRTTLCATVWVGGRETVVGYATTTRGARQAETVLADERLAPGVGAIVRAALAAHAAAA